MLVDLTLSAHTVASTLVAVDPVQILAQTTVQPEGATNTVDFFKTPLGKPVLALLRTLGVIVVLFTLVKSGKEFITGKIGPGVKILASGLLFAALCIQPTLLIGLITVVGDLLKAAVGTFDQVV